MTTDQKQRKYDRIHHSMRLAELSKKSPLDSFDVRLMQQSEAALMDASGMACYRSVDLNDAQYLRELDAFEAA